LKGFERNGLFTETISSLQGDGLLFVQSIMRTKLIEQRGRTWNAFWAVVAVVSALTGVSIGQGNGSIHGIVLDDIGKPVKDATVYATPLDRPLASVIPCDISDEGGAYSISTLDYGRYSVSVAKPDEGYPESDMTFYTGFHARLNVVKLSAKNQSKSMALHLGKKAGILKGTVAEVGTGKPLNANVEFRWVSDPQNFLSGSGLANAQFRILVPSDVAVTMVVSLAGYDNWSVRKAVLLHPGEELNLSIRLRPKQ
jgi:hypothetical protein